MIFIFISWRLIALQYCSGFCRGNGNHICKTEKETHMYRTEFWTVGEGEGGMFWENSIETSILSRVKQITSPGWMHETNAQGWCTEKTQRDGMGRKGGLGWGAHVNPWLIHVNVWQKPLQYCKVSSLQLIKINEKKKVLMNLFAGKEGTSRIFSCTMWNLVAWSGIKPDLLFPPLGVWSLSHWITRKSHISTVLTARRYHC